jgi:hypothetical protein
MSLAFGRESEGWIESRKHELAKRLGELVERYGDDSESEPGEHPYVEVDAGGVRLRRITHLDDDHQAGIAKQADQIYREVMLCPVP